MEDEQVEYLKYLCMLYLQMLCAFLFSVSIQNCVHSYVPWMGSYKDKSMNDYYKVSTKAINLKNYQNKCCCSFSKVATKTRAVT